MNSNNMTARAAGLLYLMLAGLGGFAFFFLESLIVPGDAAATANNIMASESLFRLASVSDLIGQLVFILLVLVLYRLLEPVSKNLAWLMVILALVGIPIAMLNVQNQFAALTLLSGANYLTAFNTDQLHAQAMVFLELREAGINVAQIFWGVWLLPLGALVYKSGFLPRVIGVLLIIAGFGYVIDSFSTFLFSNYDAEIAQFTFVGEVLLLLWLLIKGVNVEKWEQRALESA